MRKGPEWTLFQRGLGTFYILSGVRYEVSYVQTITRARFLKVYLGYSV